MISIRNIERLETFNNNNTYILIDFDRTLTDNKSIGSWNIISNSDFVNKEFANEIDSLYKYYRPLEINNKISYEEKRKILPEWWQKNIDLIIKHEVSEDMITSAAFDVTKMNFREGAKEFLEKAALAYIPVIIVSAGIGNFIDQFLQIEGCNYKNISIVSNMLEFKNGVATGIRNELIHTFNKRDIILPEEVKRNVVNRGKALIYGDTIGDARMLPSNKHTFKVGFLEQEEYKNKSAYTKEFDIVATDNMSYTKLHQKVKQLNNIYR